MKRIRLWLPVGVCVFSHLHCPLKLRFLECPPDVTGNKKYVDEAEMFFSDPLSWMRRSFSSQEMLPTHVVMFDCLGKVKQKQIFNCNNNSLLNHMYLVFNVLNIFNCLCILSKNDFIPDL